MKKLFALLAVAIGVVACQKDQADMGVNLGGEQEVMINVSLPDETRTGSADGFDLDSLKTDANYQLRYILEIYRDGAEDGKKYRDVKYSDDTSVSFPVRLAPGRAYSIAVWADVVEQVENAPGLYYNAESLKNISINESYWTAMDEKRDAFYGKASLDTDDHVADMSTITLKRPFAKIRVISTDIDAVRNFDLDPTNVSVEYLSELYTSFDAVSGVAVGATTSNKIVTADYTTAKYGDFDTAEATLFADYIFVPANGTIQFAMTVNAAAGVINTASFTTPIPVEVNKVTTIKGDVLTEGGNVSVKIENELGEKETINMVNTAESLQEIINNTQVGESANIALGGDIDLDDLLGAGILSTRAAANAGLVIPEGKSVVLDLNGFTISQSKACDASYSMITNNGNLTILGGGVVEFTNTAEGGGSTWGTYTIENRGEGVLTIDNATIRHNGCVNGEINHDTNIAIQNYQGKVVVNNGTIVSTQFRSLRDFTAGGEIIINGGTFLGQVWMQGLGNGSSSLTITGGSFSPVEGYDGSSVYITNNTNVVNVAITGGMFNTKVGCFDANKEGAKGCITGGTFTTAAKENTAAALINDDYAWVEAENGLWTLDRKDDVAKIGDVGYTSLAKAVAAVKDGETITLVSDITLENIAVLADRENVVLDGNGKTLTSSAGRAINVSGAQNVTIKDLTINASGERAINIIQNSTNITVENVTATAANYTVNVASSAPNAVVAIKNSTLNGLCTVNVAAAGAYVTVDGSTVNCNDNNTTAGEAYAALSLNREAVGGKIIATNTTINVAEGSDSTAGRNGAEDGVVTINGSVEGVVVMNAAITYPGSDYYHAFTTIKAAVEFAKSGDVISLIRNVELTEPLTISAGKPLTIDLNGKKLSATSTQTGKNYDMVDVRGTLTVKNGTMEYEHLGENMGWGASTNLFNVTAGGVLNLNGVTAKNLGGSDMGFVAHLNNWGEVTLNVENSTLESNYVAVRVFNSGYDMNNVTIKNSTLKGGSYAFWVHNYTVADFGSEAKAEAQKALLNFDIFNGTNTFIGKNETPIRYGMTNAIYTVAGSEIVSTTEELEAALEKNASVVNLLDGEYEMPQVQLQGKSLTIKGSKDVVIDASKIDARNQFVTGATLAFEGVTINFGKDLYMGFANTVSLKYKNCHINGLQFLFGENVEFENCTFDSNGAEHSVWTYGVKNVSFTDCNFTYGDRCVNCYSDNDVVGGKQTVNFTNCTFTTENTASEGAVEINSCFFSVGIEVNLKGCTAPAYGEMAWVSRWDSTNGAKTTINVK